MVYGNPAEKVQSPGKLKKPRKQTRIGVLGRLTIRKDGPENGSRPARSASPHRENAFPPFGGRGMLRDFAGNVDNAG
jgi:hypothetical protein